ncbi:MAG: glycosyltransferase [Betaproteobacteria bacterium]|nr:glycosyltransferase [Betaproteobacteria bacterium]
MRVMHLIESLEFGGAEKVVIDLANAMAARHTVVVCCVKKLGDLRNAVRADIPVLCLGKGEGNDWRVPFRLRDLMREHRIEVLHSHNWGVFLEGALAAWLSPGVVLVNTVHGPYMDYAPGWTSRFKQRARHLLERIASWRYRAVVLVSDAIAAYIARDIGIANARLTTIRNGIAALDVSRVERREDGVRFITVGRLAEVKNQAMVIRAFHDAGCKDAELWIAGDGPERANLEQLSSDLGLTGRVRFLGFCDDVTPHLAQCDIFVMSSHYEGISIAVLEAMRAGLPVLGTDVGGMRETVEPGHTGELVPAGGVDALAACMRRVAASSSERQRLGTAGRAKMLREFSMENMVGRYEELYKKPLPE